MAKRSSRASRRQWTESDARRVLDDWEHTGGSLEAFATRAASSRSGSGGGGSGHDQAATLTALTLVPATVVGSAPTEPAVVILLQHGIAIELTAVSPVWVAALARELVRSQS